jgi:hypothetical protein
MELLHHGVDQSVEGEGTGIAAPDARPGRYLPADALLALLESL